MSYPKPIAAEIDKKLRDDFKRRMKDFGVSAESNDPVLAVLFRTFAGQLEALYSETDRIRLALLEELIAGLGIERRMARAAQSIVRCLPETGSQFLDAGTELTGEAQNGEKLIFATDSPFSVSTAQIAFGATYQNGLLQLISGIEMPEEIVSSRPSLEPVSTNLGPVPAIFFVIENLPENHLSHNGIFFELSPTAAAIQHSLLSETWCLATPEGVFGAKGILRPLRASGGVRELRWLLSDESEQDESESSDSERPILPDGFYAGRVFVFPNIPRSRRFLCRSPKAMTAALGKLFGAGATRLFEKERAWIRISMPRETGDLPTGILSASLHAMSVSNVECHNQTVYFEKAGTSIPVTEEAGAAKHLVAPLSILGESGDTYVPEFEPFPVFNSGRYAVRNGRIELQPKRGSNNVSDTYANLRVWLTTGSLGNTVGPGQINVFARKPSSVMRISNPTSAAGGNNGEGQKEAQSRFAEALLSRDRVVTRADLVAVVRAFDRRIFGADISSGLERTGRGLERVQLIQVILRHHDFTDPENELPILQEELTAHLQERSIYGTELRVELTWE